MSDAKWERECVNALRDAGYHAVRMPASGGATAYHLPDIIVGQPLSEPGATRIWNIEHKATRKDRLYLPKREAAQPEQFSRDFGGTTFVGVRWVDQTGGREHYLFRPSGLRDSGKSYVAERADALDRAEYVVRPNTGRVITTTRP